jgi:hypothetical protein
MLTAALSKIAKIGHNEDILYISKEIRSRVLVAHACNPGYSGAEIREIVVQSQSRKIVRETLSQINPSQKQAGGVTKCIGPKFKPQYLKKKKKREREREIRKL